MLSAEGQPIPDQNELQQQLLEKSRNLEKLKEQQALFAAHTPPHILIQIEEFEVDMAGLGAELQAIRSGQYSWQALVIDADKHWREIIGKHVGQLGGGVIEFEAVAPEPQRHLIDQCAMAIIATSPQPNTPGPADRWIEDIVNLGHNLPIILMTGWENRDLAARLRQAFRTVPHTAKLTTVFKDTFDAAWFAKIIQHTLAGR